MPGPSPNLPALSLVRNYAERGELLALRSLCRGGQPFHSYAKVNEDAAVLAVGCFDLKLRSLFARLERQLCHRTSPWRLGFVRCSLAHQKRAFWACRGISRSLGREAPQDVEDIVALYCGNSVESTVRLNHRALSALSNLLFHWHRRFYEGLGGPADAIGVVLRILQGSGAEVLKLASFVRSGLGEVASADGQDLSERVRCDADLLTETIRMLLDARSCIAAHPARFGMSLQAALDAEALVKEELREREAREERLRAMGFEAAADPRM